MRKFEHVNAPDVETAIALLQHPQAKAIAGGTDLLTELKERLRTPERLVNLKTIKELRAIENRPDELRIGALATLNDIEAHPVVRDKYPILSQAISVTASPQLRNAGTLGGNLCQSVRCWYYRHPDVNCWLKGGDTCLAEQGVNCHHAIFGSSPCVAVHPSDLAPALIALDAQVRIVGPDLDGELSLEEIFTLPREEHRQRTLLEAADLVAEVLIPGRPDGSNGIYLKAMDRADWSFALVSVAMQIDWTGDRIENVCIVLGGVAGRPWRSRGAEKLLHGQTISEALADQVGEAAVAGAQPLQHNGYKIPLTRNLVKRALLELAASKTG
ncbi:MAG: FAD binding domain-containing protein [Candidatus Bipolaricaulia bacterium]